MSLYVRARQVADTLLNFVSGLGTAKDPRTATQFIFQELNRQQLEQRYRSDWLARRIVDLPAEDATREWRQWTGDRAKLEKIGALEKKFDIQKKTRQALQRARLYGGAALVIGVDQGQPEEELELDDVGLNDLKFVVVVNRYELSAGPRIFNVDSPWYTRPEYYTVSTPMFGFFGEEGGSYPTVLSTGTMGGTTSPFVTPSWKQGQAPPPPKAPGLPDKNRQVNEPNYGMIRMHPSRVIEFTGNELPDWRLAPLGGGWGDSVLQTVDDALRDFAMIVSGLASMINDMKMDVIKVPDLSRKLSTDDITRKTLERFGLANMAKSSINTLLLDKEEEWERIQTSFGSTPELIKVAMTLACAAGGVPETRIMGNAPNKGLASSGNSGGEVDIRNYYDDVASKQKSQYKPMMVPLDRCLQQSALGKYDESIDYEWNPLYQPTAQEQAAMALAKAQTTQVYVTTGLINEDALREAVVSQLTEDGIYPGLEDAIDEFGSEPEEPPAALQAAPPDAPPGMVPKGQFEANPFHMLRAQTAAAKGQPIKVPPNRPAGATKYEQLPPGAQQQQKPNGSKKPTRDGASPTDAEWIEDDEEAYDDWVYDDWSDAARQAALEARQARAKGKEWTAYHGSPRDFDKFDSSHVKAGAHEQYGHGIYVTDSKAHAHTHAQAGDEKGHLYTVGVGADKAKFVDLDKPLSEQTAFVQQALAKAGALGRFDPKAKLMSVFGSKLHAKALSDKLASVGIHGFTTADPIDKKGDKIIYAHNYVVFHAEHLRIKAKADVRDAIDFDELDDFNPYHDPETGRFVSGERLAHTSGTEAVAGALTARQPSKARSEASRAAHVQRRAREAEPFPVPPNASSHEVGITAVSRVIAAHKGHATKGEIAKAAKADVMQAVESFAGTQHLKTPNVPEGMNADNLKTSYKVAVAMRKFFTDPSSRNIIAQTVSRRSMSFMQGAAAGLPGHALEIAHKAVVDRIVDYTTEAVTDVALAGIVSAATAVGGLAGAGAAAAASPVIHAEIGKAVDNIAKQVGFTPEHIKEMLHGVGHALLDHYRKFKHFARHELLGTAPLFTDAEPDGELAFDPVEETLKALIDVLGEDDEPMAE